MTNLDNYTEELEDIVDKHSLQAVLSALMSMCYDKSEHVMTNWQDKEQAKSWTRDGNKLEAIWDKLEN